MIAYRLAAVLELVLTCLNHYFHINLLPAYADQLQTLGMLFLIAFVWTELTLIAKECRTKFRRRRANKRTPGTLTAAAVKALAKDRR